MIDFAPLQLTVDPCPEVPQKGTLTCLLVVDIQWCKECQRTVLVHPPPTWRMLQHPNSPLDRLDTRT